MLKPFTLSLSLAVALGLCSVSKAGLHDSGCSTCGLASPQGVVASPQSTSGGCGEAPCKPKHQWGSGLKKMCGMFHHNVSYEWVLKKKHNWSFGHGNSGCSTCGTAAPVYATGQGVSPTSQTVPSGQYSAPSVYGAGQHTFMPARTTTTLASVPAEMTPAAPGGEEVPPAPEVRGNSSGLLLPTPSGN
ncbi:MAG: hypothetical protein ACLQGP_21615 [Isosphaeraceae bacterium]